MFGTYQNNGNVSKLMFGATSNFVPPIPYGQLKVSIEDNSPASRFCRSSTRRNVISLYIKSIYHVMTHASRNLRYYPRDLDEIRAVIPFRSKVGC